MIGSWGVAAGGAELGGASIVAAAMNCKSGPGLSMNKFGSGLMCRVDSCPNLLLLVISSVWTSETGRVSIEI